MSDCKDLDELWAEAQALQRSGELEAAAECLGRLIRLAPSRPDALQDASVVAFRRGLLSVAIDYGRRAVELAPEHAVCRANLAEFLRQDGRGEEALAQALRAVELAPDWPEAHYNLGILHYERLELERAIACQRRALALNPDFAAAHFELAEALLLGGDLQRGWEEYEWRFGVQGVPPPLPPGRSAAPAWDGKPLPDGRLLLVADQGFGDVIQFCRYLPPAAERCAELTVACSREMQPLVAQLVPGLRTVVDWDRAPPFDAWGTLSGLPRLFGTTLATIPAPVPYLSADPERLARWAHRLEQLLPPGARRVGLVWAGRPEHGNDRNRSLRLATLAPLAELPDVALVSLQLGAPQAEIAGYFGRAPLVNLGAEIEDFADTAAILELLDRLVSVDTAVAHLAGALGRPVSILLPYAPDWRWLLGRSDSPWYPTAELFRQEAPRDWSGPVNEVARRLYAGS